MLVRKLSFFVTMLVVWGFRKLCTNLH